MRGLVLVGCLLFVVGSWSLAVVVCWLWLLLFVVCCLLFVDWRGRTLFAFRCSLLLAGMLCVVLCSLFVFLVRCAPCVVRCSLCIANR